MLSTPSPSRSSSVRLSAAGIAPAPDWITRRLRKSAVAKRGCSTMRCSIAGSSMAEWMRSRSIASSTVPASKCSCSDTLAPRYSGSSAYTQPADRHNGSTHKVWSSMPKPCSIARSSKPKRERSAPLGRPVVPEVCSMMVLPSRPSGGAPWACASSASQRSSRCGICGACAAASPNQIQRRAGSASACARSAKPEPSKAQRACAASMPQRRSSSLKR